MQQSDFEKVLAQTLAAHGRSLRTQETYTLMLRLFGRYLRQVHIGKALDTVCPEDVEAYQRYLVTERKVGFSSFNQSTCALRFFYRTCLGRPDWTIARMPFQRKRRALPEILSPEEIAAIFDACHNLKHRALLMTSYSGGLRLGETLALLQSDIDSTRMMIRIEQGKGRKDRYVMLSGTLLDELRVYWKAFRPVRWLFEGRRSGEPLSPSTAEKVFTTAAGRAGVTKGVSFHSLRHAFATHLLEGGTNLCVIQALLGHQSLTTTQVYIHVARTYVNATASPLDALRVQSPKQEVRPGKRKGEEVVTE
jgi:site-specific recombinase XerD